MSVSLVVAKRTALREGHPRVVLTLAAVEGQRLLRHPLFLAGAALSAFLAFEFGRKFIGGGYFVLMGPALLPLALMTLLAANLTALRSRRHDTEELYGSLPAPARARTLAQLLALVWPVAAAGCLVGVGYLYFGAYDGLTVTREGMTAEPGVAVLAQGPIAVAVLGALGVALARWLPYLPAAPVAAVGLLVVETPLTTWNVQAPAKWFAPAVNIAQTPAGTSWPCTVGQDWPCAVERFAIASAGWHLLYLVGLGSLLGALALLRHRVRPQLALAALAGAALVTAAGLLQLP